MGRSILIISENVTSKVRDLISILEKGLSHGSFAKVDVSETTDDVIKKMLRKKYDKIVWIRINKDGFEPEEVRNEMFKEGAPAHLVV